MKIQLQNFVDRFEPGHDNAPASRETVERYRGLLPDSLLELWTSHGFGLYGGGRIQLIDPDHYRENLWGWLMRDEEDMDRLPIALGPFGEIFYYRSLSDDGDEDVAWLDPHTSESDVVIWSLDDFFNEWCCADDSLDTLLDPERFAQAVAAKGTLEADQIYHYVPALRLGGSGSIDSVERGAALPQLEILLQLALSQ